MPQFAVSEFILMICALYAVSRIFRLPNSLPALIGLLLLAITSAIATLRYALYIQGELASMHGLYSSLSASVGMLLILISFITLKAPALLYGNRQWVSIVVVTVLFAAAAIFRLVGPLVTIATIAAIAATIVAGGTLFNEGRRSLGVFTIFTGLFFLMVGSLVGSRGPDLFGVLPRWHVFYLTLACWCLAVGLSFRGVTLLNQKTAQA